MQTCSCGYVYAQVLKQIMELQREVAPLQAVICLTLQGENQRLLEKEFELGQCRRRLVLV